MNCGAKSALLLAFSRLFIALTATKNIAKRSIFTKDMDRGLPEQWAECAQVSAVSLLFRGVAQFCSAALNPFSLAGLLGSFLVIAQQWCGLAVHGFSFGQSTQAFNHSS